MRESVKIREEFLKLGKKVYDNSTYDGPIFKDEYVLWLEDKISQKDEE